MELVLKDLTHASAMEYPLIPSPATDVAGQLTPPRDFNLMFQTSVGAMADASSSAYLRPGTYICSRFDFSSQRESTICRDRPEHLRSQISRAPSRITTSLTLSHVPLYHHASTPPHHHSFPLGS